MTTTRPSTHDRQQAVNAARTALQARTNRSLSDLLSRLADNPRRWSPVEREAILRTAAARLWNADEA